MTERVSSQKDNGEPELSPDGRYLYYSKDVTPGLTFEYNKDPNGTIYAIMHRAWVSGRITAHIRLGGCGERGELGELRQAYRRAGLDAFAVLRDDSAGAR